MTGTAEFTVGNFCASPILKANELVTGLEHIVGWYPVTVYCAVCCVFHA